jgi:hypothetical protein
LVRSGVSSSSLLSENHKAEEMANGEVGLRTNNRDTRQAIRTLNGGWLHERMRRGGNAIVANG